MACVWCGGDVGEVAFAHEAECAQAPSWARNVARAILTGLGPEALRKKATASAPAGPPRDDQPEPGPDLQAGPGSSNVGHPGAPAIGGPREDRRTPETTPAPPRAARKARTAPPASKAAPAKKPPPDAPPDGEVPW